LNDARKKRQRGRNTERGKMVGGCLKVCVRVRARVCARTMIRGRRERWGRERTEKREGEGDKRREKVIEIEEERRR
jgi:hypothetical protein